MPIHIYNSLTRQKEEFIPLNPAKVNIYSCGVTVYDDCHIGHARSLYIFEVIRRYLKYRGFQVNFVRNITDIDDKIINRANELKIDWKELVKKYIDRYYKDLAALSIPKADKEPRATENISDMVKHSQILIDKGYAYVTDTGVYFSVRKFKGYGKLSGQSIEQMLRGVRKEVDETKVDPLDFALWKKSKPEEPSWMSPWGEGHPGWHIECSVMSTKYLKTDTLDIHAGGRDLIFPHHENEIAQSEALTGKTFAKYWIHHGLLTINGQKMAKSLGNFVTITDFLERYKYADILKLFFLSAHYSHPIDYTDEKILESVKQRQNFDDFFDKVNNWGILAKKTNITFSGKDKSKVDAICDDFQKAMDDDFNTPQALACLFGLIDLGVKFVSIDNESAFQYIKSKVEEFFDIFCLKVPAKEPLNPQAIKLIEERDLAKKNKDFQRADDLRNMANTVYNLFISDTANNVTATKRRSDGSTKDNSK
jgi:cysteinyl-tRNA synthetase